jgi:hypothetical protein
MQGSEVKLDYGYNKMQSELSLDNEKTRYFDSNNPSQ